MTLVHMLVEGVLDEAAASRVIEAAGHTPGTCYGKKGSGYIRERIGSFNETAKGTRFLALVDLMDTGCDCAPRAATSWLPRPNRLMIFRIVEREIESWVLADRDALARFLKIRTVAVPQSPEAIADPKQCLVSLARRSRSRAVRDALVPEPGSTAQVGRLYNAEVANFIRDRWNIEIARRNAPSLDRAILRLSSLPKK